jgi:hypothetical protein
LNNQGTISKCPELEIGRNSVSPWTMPRMMACRMVKRAPSLVGAAATRRERRRRR